jgi:hypothetical protein
MYNEANVTQKFGKQCVKHICSIAKNAQHRLIPVCFETIEHDGEKQRSQCYQDNNLDAPTQIKFADKVGFSN